MTGCRCRFCVCRYLRGLAPKNTTFMVDGTVVGTEALFAKAAVFY